MVWENIYKNRLAGSYLKYPSDSFASIFFKSMQYVKSKKNALDYGCGSGNNSEVIRGFFENLSLVDISDSAIEIASKRLSIPKNRCFNTLENVDETYDFIAAWNVLCYNTQASLQNTIKEFSKHLHSGGVLMCSISTTKDCKANFSDKVAPNQYVISHEIPEQEGADFCAFETVKEFVALFENDFSIIDYGEFCRISHKNKKELISEWYLVAQKK